MAAFRGAPREIATGGIAAPLVGEEQDRSAVLTCHQVRETGHSCPLGRLWGAACRRPPLAFFRASCPGPLSFLGTALTSCFHAGPPRFATDSEKRDFKTLEDRVKDN